MLVAKCHLLGWGLSRESLAKIESQIRWVADAEMPCSVKSLGVSLEMLLPEKGPRKRDERVLQINWQVFLMLRGARDRKEGEKGLISLVEFRTRIG
jgi:predicted secreted Zn-dependent protease